MSNYLKEKVKVKLSIPPEKVEHNLKSNLHQIPNWLGDLFYPNGFKAYIVSAGPSMEKYVEDLNLKERMDDPERDFVVFCVKHALPRLIEMGVEPDFCVILDGREFDEKSTHGINRKGLFKTIPDKTIFLVASMSDPGYANYLMTHGARVLGWHTSVTGIEKFVEGGVITEPVISGGTSSGTRCISIATSIGIRDITLVGFDSCVYDLSEEKKKELDGKGRPKYMTTALPVKNPATMATPDQARKIQEVMQEFGDEGYSFTPTLQKVFWTTGELLAQAQDFEKIFANPQFDFKLNVLDDGMVSHMFHNMEHRPTRSYNFISYFRDLVPRKNPSKFPKRTVTFHK